MDETTNNVTWWNTTSTTSDNNSVWFPYYSEPVWEPYVIEKYEPKWHIKEGYKNQLKHMWD
jgi:hypothetical protein